MGKTMSMEEVSRCYSLLTTLNIYRFPSTCNESFMNFKDRT